MHLIWNGQLLSRQKSFYNKNIKLKYLLSLAEERIRNDNAPTIPFEKILAEDGLTIADLEAMEDVEIE